MALTTPGITVQFIQSPTARDTAVGFNTAFFFGVSASGTKNTPIKVNSVAEFTTTFGASSSLAIIEEFFKHYSKGSCHFVRCEDPAVVPAPVVGTGVLDKAHLVFALGRIIPEMLGFVAAPEFFQRQTANAERVSIATSLNSWATTHNFVVMVDCGEDTDSETKAIALVDLLAGLPKCFFYYPYARRQSDAKLIPASVYAIAFTLLAIANSGTIQAGAGVGYPLSGAKGLVDVVDSNASLLSPKNINPIRKIGSIYAIFDVLSIGGTHLTTAIAQNLLVVSLKRANSLFKSFSPTGAEVSQLIGEIELVLQQLDSVGCFSFGSTAISEDLPADRKYAISTDRINPADGSGFLDVVARLVFTLRAITTTVRTV